MNAMSQADRAIDETIGNSMPKVDKINGIKISQSGVLAPHLFDHIFRFLKPLSLGLRGDEGSAPCPVQVKSKYNTLHASALLENAALSSGRPDLGAEIGLAYPLIEAIGALVPARNEVILAVLLRDLSKMFFAIQSDAKLLLTIEGDDAIFEYQYLNGLDERRRQLQELAVASLIKMLRMILPPHLWPTGAVFPHLRGAEQDQIRKRLGSMASFGATRSAAIAFPKRALGHVCKLPEYGAKPIVLNDAASERYLALIPRAAFSVRRHVVSCTKAMETVAHDMGLSRSTLARRLAAFDVTVSDIADYLRVTNARYYLSETDVSVGDIAARLRYSEHSAFTRAFVRMFGKTPKEYRRLHQIGQSGWSARSLSAWCPTMVLSGASCALSQAMLAN